jgi:hypothetical protein
MMEAENVSETLDGCFILTQLVAQKILLHASLNVIVPWNKVQDVILI